MGSYTNRLVSRLRAGGNGTRTGRYRADGVKAARAVAGVTERLTACAIIRDNKIHSGGHLSHGAIRYHMFGDAEPYAHRPRPTDTEGFLTSTGRFVDRREAVQIANASGQCHGRVGELLSSDIDW